MNQRLKARAQRVNTECDLGELLQEYGYAVVSDRHREQQFSCDLHGHDNKPSARLYGHTNSTYCWACQTARDPVAYVMAKEHLGFREAIQFLEKRLGLSPLEWQDEQVSKPLSARNYIEGLVEEKKSESLEDLQGRVYRLLKTTTQERDLPQRKLLNMWKVYDHMLYMHQKERWSANTVTNALNQLRSKILEALGTVDHA